MGVRDQLFATGNDQFQVLGSESYQLTINATELNTVQSEFVNFLRTVMYVTDDQSGSSEHSISLVVREHPLDSSPPSEPAVIPVVIQPVNDRPVLLSTQRSEHILTDYLPQSANEGFSPSFLINGINVDDVDSDPPPFVGLAITASSDNGRGSWMVWDNGTWVSLSSVSDCSPQLVSPDDRVRFVPSPDYSKTPSQASLVYRAWDGSTSQIDCTDPFSNLSTISAENETFTYNIEYLNRAPVIIHNQYNLSSTEEDTPSEAELVGTIAGAVANDSDDLYLGLAVVSTDSSNGVWEYQSMGNWVEFPTWLSPQAPLLLANYKQIRFIPNEDFSGLASFDALAWDMSDNTTNPASSDPYTGSFSTSTTTFFIHIVSINDPPVIQVGVREVEYTEGGPSTQVFRNLSISDVDSEQLVWAEVVLDCPMCLHSEGSGDIGSGIDLVFNSTDTILTRHAPPNFLPTVQYSDSMGIVLRVDSVTGTDSSPAEFVRYLESLHFASISREPSTAPRTVTLTVSDGLSTSNIISVNISIVLINDEPPLLTLPYSSITWTEDSDDLQLFTSPVTITDLDGRDSLLENATLSLHNYNPNFESLTLNCSQFSLSCSYKDGVLTIENLQSTEMYQQALREVYYVNSNPEPEGRAREIQISVFDRVFLSRLERLVVDVELINDQLPVVMVDRNEVIFQEPGTNPITTSVRVAPGLTISDGDSGSFLLHSATVTISDPQDGTSEGLRLLSGVTPSINVTGQYQHSLTISYEGGIPLMTLQDAIREVEYFNSAEQQYPANRTIQITVNDTLTLDGDQTSLPVEVIVIYILVDDLPEVRLMENILMYSEGQTPQQLHVAVGASIVDVDSTELSRLDIILSADAGVELSGDRLEVNLTGFEGTIDGSIFGTSIVLTGEASLSAYMTVLRTLTYQHTGPAGDQDSGIRTITAIPYSVSGDLGVSGTVMVAFTAVNNAPIVDLNGELAGLNGSVVFQEERPEPLPLVDVNINDLDNQNLTYMRIELVNRPDGELEFISISDDPEANRSSIIEVMGPSPISEFEGILSRLTYQNLADEPDTTTRIVTVEVSDGELIGRAQVEIVIAPQNDRPVVLLNNSQVVYLEDGAVNIASGAQVFDPDSLIVGYRVRPQQLFPGDVVSGQNLSYTQGSGVYMASLSPTAPAELGEILEQVIFTSTEPEPAASDREFCISVHDMELVSSVETCVTVTVQVINDNFPEFDRSFYQGEVAENAPNVPVARVSATDADSANSNVTLEYSITAGDDCSLGSGSGEMGPLLPETEQSCRFQIDPLTGEVRTTSTAPDRELRDRYSLTVSVSDGELTNETELVVIITDVNDVAPVFVPDIYEVSIPVGAPEGYLVAQLTVDDADVDSEFSLILLSMDPSIAGGVFDLDPNIPGGIFLNRLERDLSPLVSQYTLLYEAIDSSIPFHSSTNRATVVVNITQNQQPPVFDTDSYTETVSESALNGVSVLTVTATDTDPGYHGNFTFSILDSEVPFAIDPESGIVSVSDSTLIDYEEVQEYVFTVVATDTGRPPMSSTADIRVAVVNENDNPPTLDQDAYFVDVCESVPVGYEFLQLSVQDADGDTVSYDVMDMFGCGGCVAVNSSTGTFSIAMEVDYEQVQTISFSVVVSDGVYSPIINVTLNILNDNEVAPEFLFESVEIEIPETEEVGSFLPLPEAYVPLAHDMDGCSVDQCDGPVVISNQTCTNESGLQYSIISGNEEGLFQIDPLLGIVSVARDLDADVGPHQLFNLSLRVSDGMFFDIASMMVVVTDINDNLPQFENNSYSVTIPENIPVGTIIITTLATDLDPSDVLHYSLIDENGHFNVTENGEIFVVGPLDFESISHYSLIVTVTDRPYTANATVIVAPLTIYISDVNDSPPMFLSVDLTLSVVENSPSGPVGEVQAVDSDPVNASLLYSILSDDNGGFIIDSLTGEIQSTRPLDREFQDIYDVVVQVIDNGVPPLSASTTVRVMVEDVNESPPMFSIHTPPSINVSEIASVGSVILTLTASDADSNMVGFRIVNGDNDTFSLQSPALEGSAMGSSLMDDSLQSVDLVLAGHLDYEGTRAYNLVVEVFDMPDSTEGVSLSSTIEIEVLVSDANDNPPVFSEPVYTAEIEELSATGTFVTQVQATDADSGSNAATLFDLQSSNELFSIHPETGIITVNRSELVAINLIGEQYMLNVTAYNTEPPYQASFATVIIQLLDINDNAPFFPDPDITFTIAEDFTPTGSEGADDGSATGSGSGLEETNRLISTVVAVDLDRGSNAELQFSLLTGTERFLIDPVSGDLFVTGSLDREEQESYSIQVHVTDLGSPPLTSTTSVLVIVTDINDNAPIFQRESYTGSVAENQPEFFNVIPLSATDADIGENAEIIFSVVGGNYPFTVDQQSGYIQTTQSLDSETQNSYSFQVEARTGDLFSLANVTILVEDVNEFSPAIVPAAIILSLAENTPIGALVQPFTISDEDSGAGAESVVSLRPLSNLFSVDNSSNLLVAGLIDYEVIQSVSFAVVARNLAPPHFETVADVYISIENENDNPPIVGFGVSSVFYDELIQRRVNLDVGISISDADGRDATRIIDGIVKFENSFLEPSFAYEPVTSGNLAPEFNCQLEVNKLLKFSACGIPDVTVLSEYTEDALQLHGGLRVGVEVVGHSIVFDASLQQYALYIGNIGTLGSSGLTISTWIWYEPTASSGPQAILSKISSSQLLYGVFCESDGSLVFNFTSSGSAESVVFNGGCSALRGAWHHLGIVVDNTNTQWSLNIFIDGVTHGSVGISQPFDGTGGLLLGASRDHRNSPTTNFFNGQVHMLVVSLSSSSLNSLNCVTGCGLVLISLQDSPLTHYYDYTERALIAEGTEPVATYEEFLGSLVLVLPFTEPRISQYMLSYTVQDEVFNCLPTFIDIIVIPSNDFQPELSLNGTDSRDYSTVFVEESGAVALVNTATFYLRDMDLIEFPYVVGARVVDALQPFTEEILAVHNIPEGMNVSYSEDFTLTLTGLLPLPMFEAVLRTLTYNNIADEPLGSSREIVITVSDPPLPDVFAQSMVELVFVNDHPELFLVSSITEYSEGDEEMLLLDSATIEDSDSQLIHSVIVTFTPLDPGMEFLSVNTSGTNIITVYNSTSASLTLSGADTQQRYEDVLLSLTYEHTGMAAPTLGTRRFIFVVSDGEADSSPVTVSLFFAAVNDAPVINLSSNFTVNFVEDSDMTVDIVSADAVILDVDSDSLSYLNLTLLDAEESESISVTVPSDIDTITAVAVGGSFITVVPTSGTSAPLSDFVTILRTARYTNVAEEPTPGTHTIQLLVSDGMDVSLPVFREVNIMAVNDPPRLDLDTDFPGTGFMPEAFEERGDPVGITGRSISLIDNDVVHSVEFIQITIQGAVDGLDERITSSNPSFILPLPSNGQSITYLITQENINTTDPVSYLTSLQYNNTRLEPTPGERIITISVSDGVDFSNTALVLLTVVGINENTPQFTMNMYSFTTTESLLPPVLLDGVTAIDMDDGVDGTVSYEIAASLPTEGFSYFTINATSGLISVTQELDREEIEFYELTIVARDGGLPQQTASATVSIMVADVNDNPPVFYPDGDNVEIMVLETASVGQVVETVPLIDPDSGIDIISLQLGNTAAPFTVNVFNHQVTVAGDLDVDSQSSEGCINDGRRYELPLVATDAISPFPSSTATLSIHVVDVNDNPPQFVSGSYFTVTEENVDLSLFTVTATDLDCTTNGEITYSFQRSFTYSLFNISESTGVVSSLQSLDREELVMYSFTVVATDGGSPRMSAITDITLEVLDINDNAPVFGEGLYEYEVREDEEIAVLTGIQATDIDNHENGQIAAYTLDSTSPLVNPSTGLPFFTINPLTGDIIFNTTGLAAEFEFEPSYTFTVFAVDSGSPSLTGSAAVTVNVTDINDNSPVVSTTAVGGEVPENVAGYLVASFIATDADSGENSEVTFSLLDNLGVFSIHPTTGELTTAQRLDFEDQCYYTINVVATDRGLTPLTSLPYLFEVFVQPEEDVAPEFEGSPFTVSVPENSPAGTVVTRVTAEDGDLDVCLLDMASGSGYDFVPEGLTYTFNETSENFVIDEQSGAIHLLQPLDFEETRQHILAVIATDTAGLQAEGRIVINVLDRNDVVPQFLQPFYEATVPENVEVGSSVLQVMATDEDTLDQGRLVFSLTESSPYFDIESSTGTVFISGAIDFETAGDSISLSAQVTDSAANSATVPVNIYIVDINDIPPVINTQPETLLFIEGQVSLRPFITLDISDSDSFQHICNATVLLYSPEQVTATPPDQCSCSDTTSASTCTPDCLEFLQLSPGSFPGTVHQLEGGSELVLVGNYSIEEYETALEAVEYVNIIFDPTPQLRTVSLSVSDCQLFSNTLVQSIDIQPLNVEAPMLDLNGGAPGINFQTTFQERGAAVSIVSENVSISDEDTIRMEQLLTSINIQLTNPHDEQEHIYITSAPTGISIVSNSTHLTLSGVASLEEYTNLLRSVSYLNLAPEPNPEPRLVEFTAHEFSLSSPPVYTEILISTINDYPPSVIADPPRVNYATRFPEGSSGVGIVASTAVIEDRDSTNDNMTEMQIYILRPSPTERLLLTIPLPAEITLDESTEYSLSFSGSAPRPAYEAVLRAIQYQNTEDEFSYLFPPVVVFIQISDHSLSGFTAIQVELSPVNDHIPQFTDDSITISVPENATVGASVYQIQYTDQDTFSPTEPNFRITGGNTFSISPDTGEISLTQSLDYETTQELVFTVELRDLGYTGSSTLPASIEVTVIVTDQNDHAPMFTREVYNATIDEGASVGTSVLQLSANDRDSQMHSLLEFSVVNTTVFGVDSTGVLYTLSELDQETVPFYQFVVSVRNPGDVVADTADVFINISDVNDHPPSISLSPSTAILQEPLTRTTLSYSLSITDGDANPSLDFAVVEILGGAPGALVATATLPGISVTGSGSNSLIFMGASQSLSNYEHVLRGVEYEDTSEEPLFLTREIGYQVGSDPGSMVALNYSESETLSNVAVFQVSVQTINDQMPEILLDTRTSSGPVLPGCSVPGSYSTNYTEDNAPVSLSDGSLSIRDSDSGETHLLWVSVELLEPTSEDSLNYSGALEINTTVSSAVHLVIQGPASIAEFETALRTVAYQTSSQNPEGVKQVEFTVNDGVFTSQPALACVQLFNINDAPVVTLGQDGSVDTLVMYREGQAGGLMISPQLTITGRWIDNHH